MGIYAVAPCRLELGPEAGALPSVAQAGGGRQIREQLAAWV